MAYKATLTRWIHELTSIKMLITHPALVVQVIVGVLLHEIITAAIYRPSFTSASDEKHTIIPKRICVAGPMLFLADAGFYHAAV